MLPDGGAELADRDGRHSPPVPIDKEEGFVKHEIDRPILSARKRRAVGRGLVEDHGFFEFATSSLGGHFALPTIDTAIGNRP